MILRMDHRKEIKDVFSAATALLLTEPLRTVGFCS